MDWNEFWPPVLLSTRIALLSGTAASLLGIAVAWKLSRQSVKGKTLLETMVMLPLVLPPSVVGFLLLVLLGRNSWIGQFIEWIFAAPIVFTWWAAFIASTIVAFPLTYQTMKNGYASIDRSLEDAARSDGADERHVFRYITFPLVYRSVITAFILGFARGLGEFGATLMIAGNMPGRTQTIPTAVYVAIESGDTRMAWAWTITIVIISFILLLMTRPRAGS